MKSIKNSILTPFLAIIIIIPITTLLIFNIAMNIYVSNSAKQEIKNTIAAMNTIIKQEFLGNSFDFSNESVIANAMFDISNAVKASKIAVNTDILLFNQQGKLIYPENYTNDLLLQKLATQNIISNKITTVKTDYGSYLVASKTLAALQNAPIIIFVASLNSASGLILIINLILIVVMLLGISISIYIANVVSNNVSRATKTLCVITKNIGEEKFELLPLQTDILELNELTKSITQMGEKMQAQDKERKTFLQNASHALRTPLMSISGYAEGIENGVLTDVKKSAGIIKAEGKILNKLVDELLTLSRIESFSYEHELKILNLSDLLKDYKSSLDGIALKENKKITLISDEDIFILADESLLAQIVFNIAGNSLRYAKSELKIRLTNKKLIISDDGDGIDEQDLPNIFERFYKGKQGNFGLGLAIAKSAVEFLGGNIKAYNHAGAVFEINFL
ncbi:MAG: HAMP domain-containing sensor histidine kinase [Clostridia bacterium]